jgi:hypothetical protein
MRIYSTPQSAEEGEISLLAIIETIAAVSLSFWIAVHYQTVTHIFFGACLAPLFLLRTPKSTDFALVNGLSFLYHLIYRPLSLLMPVADFVTAFPQPIKFMLAWFTFVVFLIFVLLFFCAISVGSLIIRFVAIIYGVLSQPTETIKAIPNNWKRLTLATDFLHPPEVIPGIETLPAPDSSDPTLRAQAILFEWKFTNVVRIMLFHGHDASLDLSVRIVGGLIAIPLFVIIYVPVVLFRLSVKSTSLVYIPLIYVIRQPVSYLSAKESIADVVHGKGEAIKECMPFLQL